MLQSLFVYQEREDYDIQQIHLPNQQWLDQQLNYLLISREMANNSAKRNEQSIKSIGTYLTWAVYGLIAWLMLFNTFFLISESISIWHYLLCVLVSLVTYMCYKQIMKCWELQLPPEATEYYYDFLALNAFVHLLDPYTHKVWHIYWLIVLFALYHGGKWLWDYITPKYVEDEEEGEGEEGAKKKEKKEKKEKVKYIKR